MSDTNLVEDLGENRAPLKGDLTQGPILRTLITFSLPALLSNMLQTINGTINSIWVGRLLGESALAATANANIVMFLLFAAVFGLGMATTVRVGQHFGARNLDAMRRTFGSGLGFCALLAAVCGALGWVFSPQLLELLGTPGPSKQEALDYLRVIFVTMPFGTLSMIVSMSLRGTGDATTPMYCMILTVILDIILNPVLILGLGPVPELGISGSALATALANFGGVVAMIAIIYRKDLALRLRGAELRYLAPVMAEMRYIITKGMPMGAQMLLVSAAGIIMIGLVNREGLHAAAAYGASLQLWNYLQMPAFAIGSAVSAMVAQNIGAGNHSRVDAITKVGIATNLVVTSTMTVAILLADHLLLGLFLGTDSPAVPLAEHIQRICTWSFILSGVMMIMVGTMRAYGAVMGPMIIMFVAMYPARLGFYFVASPIIGTAEAVWWAYPAGSIVAVILTWTIYNYGGWRKKRLQAYSEGQPAGAAQTVPAE